jgi:hypothetical protein
MKWRERLCRRISLTDRERAGDLLPGLSKHRYAKRSKGELPNGGDWARRRCRICGKDEVAFYNGNVWSLWVNWSRDVLYLADQVFLNMMQEGGGEMAQLSDTGDGLE